MARPGHVAGGQFITSAWGNSVVDSLPPIGAMFLVPADALPVTPMWGDWLLCVGTAVSKTLYPDLFTMCGTRFNQAGDDPAGPLFRIPDLRGRYPVGRNNGGTYFAGSTGQTGGTADATGLVNHTHLTGNHVHLTPGLNGSATMSWGEVWQNWSGAEDNVDSFRLLLAGPGEIFSIVIHKFPSASYPGLATMPSSNTSGMTADSATTGPSPAPTVANANLPPSLVVNFAIKAL